MLFVKSLGTIVLALVTVILGGAGLASFSVGELADDNGKTRRQGLLLMVAAVFAAAGALTLLRA